MRQTVIKPVFVDSVPDILEDGVLYVSEKYQTAIHKCCCGCGEEVVTPLNPARWRLRKEGATVSLSPSIGNWNYPCKSHYLIIKNRVVWAGDMTTREIDFVQARDRHDHMKYIDQKNIQLRRESSWFSKLVKRLGKWFTRH